jgi:hypothetical protein
MDDCVPRLFCLFSCGPQLRAGRKGNKVECSPALAALGLGVRTTRGNNWLEKFLVFLPVFVYRALALVCAGNELLASQSRFRAPAASRQIGIVIEKSNATLPLSRSCIILLAKTTGEFYCSASERTYFPQCMCMDVGLNKWLREQGINLQRKENNGL